MFSLVASFALAILAPAADNNVHKIYCHDTAGNVWQGSGWFIRQGIMATAYHVGGHAKATCTDGTTGERVRAYKTDYNHDLALMTGSTGKSQIQYSCDRPRPGRIYHSYGYSSDFLGGDFYKPLYFTFNIKATSDFDVQYVPGFANISSMRTYDGVIMAGMSGGPVADDKGVAYALNNAGNDVESILFDLADTGLCTKKWDT